MTNIDLIFLESRIKIIELVLLKTKKDKEIYIVLLEKFKQEIKMNAPVDSESVALLSLIHALQEDLKTRL